MTFLPLTKHFSITLILCSLSVLLPLNQRSQATFPDRGKRGMVTSAHPAASEAGLTILQKGGNAIDAAVATALGISVVEPFSAGIGGGGFLLLRVGKTGEIRALDFRERAPLKATPDLYLDAQGKVRPNASVDGYLAVAVPGTIAGLYEVHQHYGNLAWQEVVAPSIRLAKEGIPVSTRLSTAIARQKTLRQNRAARQIFTRNGHPLQPGELLVQKDLAQTLQAVAQNPQSFYTGTVGAAIARDMATNGGLITLEDLKRYRPIWREPVCGSFRIYQICSMPPPSSGGVHLLQMLNLIGDMDLKRMGWHHPDALHWIVEGMKIAYADRATHLGDPDFVQVPVKALISPAYAQLRRQEIHPQKARPASLVKPGDPALLQTLSNGRIGTKFTASMRSQGGTRVSADTSHLNVVDAAGNAVSLTFTVNLGFGAGVVVPGTGIVLNNEMDDFVVAPGVPNAFGLVGGDANAIAPGKTPLSSMTPTIVTEGDNLRLVVGAPGGSTIITTVLQVILNVLVYEMDIRRAIAAPRLHHQWLPDRLRMEQWGFDRLTLADLRRRGHLIQEGGTWGNANGINRTPDGWLEGAADPRGEGSAYGF
ncbi:gamma-glutamyltransferase [Leptothermofonsia sichuanensis E412]|uniref:gamma-glutamyltransferase n=1 Tax=Leptothermofonsia sichuanensis TaxID=2917832 RepID=UPI001CA60661|nr:gamma-glutamyltransferase [Leptothermofonsia sichuanensis]QZZ22482.1 gamma-glutamyltransferase [Leptothermofonsia sichuanensis E412]